MLRRRTPMLLLAFATTLSVAVLATAAPGQAKADGRCGTVVPSGPKDIRGRGLSCRSARRVAHKHLSSVSHDGVCGLEHVSCRVVGFDCRQRPYRNGGRQVARVVCTRGAARVGFFYGT